MASKDLSSAELHLWQVVNANPNKIARMSIIQLSEFANVSTATTVRTMKKMGYSGYTSYREHLRENGKSNLGFEVLRDADDKIKSVISKNEIEVNNTLHNLKYSTIKDSVLLTRQAKMVYIFARGLSESSAQEITIKLQLAGKYVEFFSDPNIIKTISKKVRKDSIVIFVSLNGETEELVYAAKELQKNDVASILFTTNSKSSLAKLATLTFIGYETETNYFPDYEVRSRLPLQIMTRIFCDAYSVRAGITQK